jgi:hypothetical protein
MPFARQPSIVDCDLLSAAAAASSPRIASSPSATVPLSLSATCAAISDAIWGQLCSERGGVYLRYGGLLQRH